MKVKVLIARLCVDGWIRTEIANFLIEAVSISLSDPDVSKYIDDMLHFTISITPTPCARNKVVKIARECNCDFVFMLDDDMNAATGFFKTAFLHLLNSEPCVIGSPYCCGPPEERVQVLDFYQQVNHSVQPGFKITHINREEAARRSGIQRVSNIGTGCIAYNLKVFDIYEYKYQNKRFYDYDYNPDYTSILESEDCNLHRKLYFAEVPIYCAWDHWSGHMKTTCVDKPLVLQHKDIQEVYMKQAESLLKVKHNH